MNAKPGQKIESFSSDDELLMRSIFKQNNQTVASVVSVFIFTGAFAVLINGRASFKLKIIFLFLFYFPMLILFYVLYQRKLIYDLLVKKKIIVPATVNIISLFGEHKEAYIQVVFPDNKYHNFNVKYEVANSFYEGQEVITEHSLKSKQLLNIYPKTS